MPPSAAFFYWITRATVSAFLLTGLLVGLYYGARFLLSRWQRRPPPKE
jgi:hypothetical protein